MQSGLIADRYKPLFLRARGGFASVEVAWDTRLTRRVAIKRIETGKSMPLSSLEEARTVALLSSPNIVNVYDFEHTGTETLMIMENVDGPSLAELMADSTELLDIDVATTILDGVTTALEYAHENQVLHLDIKPANILIDQSGHIKVSDFGLAELAGVNGFGEVQGGTIGYMPPEQLTAGQIDARTDVWALAALSYQLLTGVNPFFALSPRESLHLISTGAYALPSELRPALDGAIDEALIKALAPNPEDRPDSVSEFWTELRPHLGKVAPGRRRLKSLARVWAGKEAASLEGEDAANLSAEEGLFNGTEALDFEPEAEGTEVLEPIAIWNGNYEEDYAHSDGSDLDSSADYGSGYDYETDRSYHAELKRQQRLDRKAQKKAERARRGPRLPLWQRISPALQGLVARIICAFAMASMTWLAMSAIPYLNDPLAQAATAVATNTGTPTPALLDAAFIVRIGLTIVVAVIGLIIPSLGGALAVLALVLGFFFTGNWLVGFLLLAACVTWWVFVGRRNIVDATMFPLSSLFAMLSIPLLTPLLSGYYQNWKRALGTTALSFFVCSLLSIVTSGMSGAFFANFLGSYEWAPYGQFSSQPLSDLLGISATLTQMPDTNQLFIPLISLFTSLEFWLVLAGWLGSSLVMSLLAGGKSRVKYVLAILLSTGILTVGYLLPVFFAGTDTMVLLAGILIRLALALIICLLLVALGVQAKPYVKEGKGRAR